MSTADPDPTAAPARPPYVIPPQDLRDMVLALPRPPADAPETAWQEVVQAGLDRLDALDPRDALQTMLAVTVIATHPGGRGRRLPAGVRAGRLGGAGAAQAGQRCGAAARDGRGDAVVEAASVAAGGAGARLGRRGGGAGGGDAGGAGAAGRGGARWHAGGGGGAGGDHPLDR